jgi:hypothetical protein
MKPAGKFAAAATAALVGFVLLIAMVVATEQDQNGAVGASGTLNTASVPAQFAPWLQRAGALCPQVSPALLAAQPQQESGFSTTAVSPGRCARTGPVHARHLALVGP